MISAKKKGNNVVVPYLRLANREWENMPKDFRQKQRMPNKKIKGEGCLGYASNSKGSIFIDKIEGIFMVRIFYYKQCCGSV